MRNTGECAARPRACPPAFWSGAISKEIACNGRVLREAQYTPPLGQALISVRLGLSQLAYDRLSLSEANT